MFLKPSEITGIHLELTSRCPLLCYQCARVHEDGVNPVLPIGDLEPIYIEKMLSEFEGSGAKITELHVCGNYGDYLAYQYHTGFLDIIKSRKIFTRLYSNGSGRSKAFWQQTATALGDNGEMVFSIDGLADTNHLYRRNAIWSKVMDSAQWFIAAGGKAIWEMLVFAHNQHQVDDARKLSETMGFHSFRVKKASRFTPFDDTLENVQVSTNNKFVDTKGIHLSAIPVNPDISCQYRARKWAYVSFEGDLLPCCWIGGDKHKKTKKRVATKELFSKYGHDFVSIKNHTVSEILSNDWYQHGLDESWANSPDSDTLPKMQPCIKQCNTCTLQATELKNKYVVYP